jgi:hypothetical protein
VVADGAGEFVISGLGTGDYEFRVRRIGYQPTSVAVRVPFEGPRLEITMVSLPRLLDSVRIRERGPAARYTGIVLDDFDQPVVEAEVIAGGASDLGVRTDSGGHFRLLKAQKGTLILRVRKLGYTPYFGSLRFMGEREDTLRMTRLAQDLPQAYILAESGFDRDTFAFAEMDSRMNWKLSSTSIASREDLDAWGDMDLCQALMRTPAAGRMRLREDACGSPRCILINGTRPIVQPLNAFMAAEVEAFEYHQSDWSGTLASRYGLFCGGGGGRRDGGGTVIWLRKEKRE